MRLINKTILFSTLSVVVLFSCGGGSAILTTPIENIDRTPVKEIELTETEKHNWGHLDILRDTVPGMSVDKAYSQIINNKKGKTVIVAVIDSGIDINHEDLDGVVWTNPKEIAGNGKDDDNNGYVDDIHGWNFLGDGYNEQLEMTRILASGNTNLPGYARAKAEFDADYQESLATKQQYEGYYQGIRDADETLKKHFKKSDYTQAEVYAIQTKNEALNKAKGISGFVYGNGFKSYADAAKELKDALDYYNDRLNYNLNKDFNGRKTGDNTNDLNDKGYGNNNVLPSKDDESHGTHVAGIIAAERNNGSGANGVANNVKIMSLRAVPNGDEYDKDIALAIRYAVDNGAQIINGSFGKAYSMQSAWVRDAIKYASDNNVVFVHAAGNDSKDVDVKHNYPDDNNGGAEISNTYIRVGALAPKNGASMIAGFSNFGQSNVDVFAPGAKIYSTVPSNGYDTKGGTSMAAPAVTGVAALVWSQYPNLKASQIKQIIMDSGLPISTKVVVGGKADDVRPYSKLCKSGKIVNAYNALVMASQLSR
jgi:subtilisin family serine protease